MLLLPASHVPANPVAALLLPLPRCLALASASPIVTDIAVAGASLRSSHHSDCHQHLLTSAQQQ